MKGMLYDGKFCGSHSRKCPYANDWDNTEPFCGFFSEELKLDKAKNFLRCIACRELEMEKRID